MRSFGWFLVLSLAATTVGGCANGEQADKIEVLERKVGTLEKRVKALETKSKGKAPAKGGKAKAPAKGAKAKAPAAPKGTVAVEGDATLVKLSNGKKQFKIPGAVPAGDYKIMAAFEESAQPAEVGTAKVTADATTTISCSAADKSCK